MVLHGWHGRCCSPVADSVVTLGWWHAGVLLRSCTTCLARISAAADVLVGPATLQAEHGFVPEEVYREVEMHCGFAVNSLTLREYSRIVIASVGAALQVKTQRSVSSWVARMQQPAPAGGGDLPASCPAGLQAPANATDVSSVQTDVLQYMPTATQSIWDAAEPGSRPRHRIEVAMKVCSQAVLVLVCTLGLHVSRVCFCCNMLGCAQGYRHWDGCIDGA